MVKFSIYIFFFLSFFDMSLLGIHLSSLSKVLLVFITGILILNELLTQNKKINLKKSKTFKISCYCLFFLLIYGLISLTWSKNIFEGIDLLSNIILLLGSILLLTLSIKNKNDFQNLLSSISLAIIIHNLIAWYEILSKNYYFVPEEYIFNYTMNGYPVSTFFNTNNFATFLSIGFFILFVSYQNKKNVVQKFVLLLAMASSIFLIIKTDSRANLAAIIIGLIVIIFMNVRKMKLKKNQIIAIHFLLSFLFIIVLYGVLFYSDTLESVFVKDKAIESNSIRFNLVKNGFSFLFETNLLGVGAGSLDYWMINKSNYITGGVVKMHNLWMEILSTYGLLSFILFLFSYLITMCRYFVLSMSLESTNSKVCLTFSSMMLSFIISSMSPSSLFLAPWSWIYLSIMYFGIKVYDVDTSYRLEYE